MDKLKCRCGQEGGEFIGNQTVPGIPYYLKLYNCLSCKTTFSVKVVLLQPLLPHAFTTASEENVEEVALPA